MQNIISKVTRNVYEFPAILKFCTDQRLFWRTTLRSVRRKALVVIVFCNVYEFPRLL